LLFALSVSLLSGLPFYILRDWLPSLNQLEYTLFFSAYLLLVPIAFLGARQSLRMLNRLEEMGGRRIPFGHRLKKYKRRQPSVAQPPRPGLVVLAKANGPQQEALLTNRRSFSPTLFLRRKPIKMGY